MVSAKTLKLAAPRGMSTCEAEAVRLAGVRDLGVQEVVEAVDDLVGDGVEQLDPLVDRHRAPLAVERGMRGRATAASTSGLPAS